MSNQEMPSTFSDWFAENLSDCAQDIAGHGADSGFSGIIYNDECATLFDAYQDELWEMLMEEAEEMDMDQSPRIDRKSKRKPVGPLTLLASFNRSDMATTVNGFKTLVVWFACEKLAIATTERQEEFIAKHSGQSS